MAVAAHPSQAKGQIFVNVADKRLSMQENLSTTTVKELIKVACYKAGVKPSYFYATYGDKVMDHNKLIGFYPVRRDSTIDLRFRLRAARNFDFSCVTFRELLSTNMHRRFYRVTLSQATMNTRDNLNTATFLSSFSAYHLHNLFMFVCENFRQGKSFNGAFSIDDILIVNGAMVIFDPAVPICNFDAQSCQNDFATLHDIIDLWFRDNQSLPIYVQQLLTYLSTFPAQANSRREPLIQFLTNHPAITPYLDRIKKCIGLDLMLRRLYPNDRNTLRAAVGQLPSWTTDVGLCKALDDVYLYQSYVDHNNELVVNYEYTSFATGCSHFAKFFFVHADYQLILQEIEAAFSQTLPYFLHETLLNIAMRFNSAAVGFDKPSLLGNMLGDPRSGR